MALIELNSTEPIETPETRTPPRPRFAWMDLLLILILLAGAYLRIVGTNWDDDSYNHPDERFLSMTTENLQPVSGIGEYFNTAASTMNPNNMGSGFYVYGTFPLMLVRYTSEWLEKTGLSNVKLIGRAYSSALDLLTVLVVYLIARRLYNRKVALLAAAFSAFTVLQIQQAHFYTTDTFSLLFLTLAILASVQILTTPLPAHVFDPAVRRTLKDEFLELVRHPWLVPSLLFGLWLGMAMASKINVFPVAVMLPGAILIQLVSLSPHEQKTQAWRIVLLLGLGALVSLLVFRILQPYAFSGPGFFNFGINKEWVDNLKSLESLSSKDADWPPAMQWARRPLWFSGQNLTIWGLGLPLGIAAWAGFLFAGWRMLKGEWRKHLLLWVWVGGYFVWQSLKANPTMRYQLPVYPFLAIFAAWALVTWMEAKPFKARRINWQKALSITATVLVLGGSMAWSFAFTRIYTRPLTRVAASNWLFENVPGPLTLSIETTSGVTRQLINYPYGQALMPGYPYETTFNARETGTLNQLIIGRVKDLLPNSQPDSLLVTVSRQQDNISALSREFALLPSSGGEQTIQFNSPVPLSPGQIYTLTILLPDAVGEVDMCAPIRLNIRTVNGDTSQYIPPGDPCVLTAGGSSTVTFQPENDQVLNSITLSNLNAGEEQPGPLPVLVVLGFQPYQEAILASAVLTKDFPSTSTAFHPGYMLTLSQPVILEKDLQYNIRVYLKGPNGSVELQGSALANEGAWDDGLPFRISGYDAFGGIYPPGLDFDMYTDDNPEKLGRFMRIMDEADYIAISSNRQYATLTRLPERFPMTTTYYRNLLGCPPEKDLIWCFRVAKPGMFQGGMGFDLVYINQSNPNLGPLEINTQFAEEAFTIYDHPKVLIFRKNSSYDPANTVRILASVDFSKITRVAPGRAPSRPMDLMLPADRLAQQRANGTWAELFPPEALYNRYPALAAVLWYLVVSLLGIGMYPLVRFVMPGLSDRGYPLVRMVGMVLLAYFVWLAGSAGIPFNRLTISIVAALLLAVSLLLGWKQWPELKAEWNSKRRYFLMIEIVALAFFLLFLFVRLGNPDLWHPSKGGEKPMDFSYLNAVLKSTTFPPYDPWFAGGYLNYYYYGFVLVGVIIKWLGITPAVAYNIFLPQLFSLVALGAFCVGWNLFTGRARSEDEDQPSTLPALFAGLSASLAVVVLGNLATVRMIWHGLQKLAIAGLPGGLQIEDGNFFQRWLWTIQGFGKFLNGNRLPFYPGDWYWIPSRVYPKEPITEFPAFTFLYGDPHAHLYALPVTLLVLAWALALVYSRWDWIKGKFGWLQFGLTILLGGIAAGALWPSNTWDLPTYATLGIVALAYTAIKYAPTWQKFKDVRPSMQRILTAVYSIILFAAIIYLAYRPFAYWFGQGYSGIEYWKLDRSPFWSYITHWGLFLFLIVSWLVWETRDWMAKTSLSALRKAGAYFGPFQVGIVLLLGLIVFMTILKVEVAWLALTIMAWALVLILRPGLPDGKRVVLFLVGTGLALTLFVEVFALKGDLGRMNMVFKLYMQAWTLLAISAAAALNWLLPDVMRSFNPAWRTVWQISAAVLIAGAALFPVTAGSDKMRDRFSIQRPHTLNGMAYMDSAFYSDNGTDMDLSQDARAIHWMQQNVKGSPVILEANIPEYRWGTRFTIYTGLPGVVGWNWHQRQQRGLVADSWVWDRVNEIGAFYNGTAPEKAAEFLCKYDVSYIIVGQLERSYYPGGIDKFEALNGIMWQRVYQDAGTAIYQVEPSVCTPTQ